MCSIKAFFTSFSFPYPLPKKGKGFFPFQIQFSFHLIRSKKDDKIPSEETLFFLSKKKRGKHGVCVRRLDNSSFWGGGSPMRLATLSLSRGGPFSPSSSFYRKSNCPLFFCLRLKSNRKSYPKSCFFGAVYTRAEKVREVKEQFFFSLRSSV